MKTYLLQDHELKYFKEVYKGLKPKHTQKQNLFIKAWASEKIGNGHALKVIVSDEQPSVVVPVKANMPLEPLAPSQDELEPESRKDNLWGDLKLLGKKAIREAKHRHEHYQKIKDNSVEVPTNLIITFNETVDHYNIKMGKPYFFQIVAEPSQNGPSAWDIAWAHMSSLPYVVSSNSAEEKAPGKIDGNFQDFYLPIRRNRIIAGTILFIMILSLFSYFYKNSQQDREDRQITSEQHQAQQKKHDQRFDELNNKGVEAGKKMSDILESRRDIGLLVKSAGVDWEGGAPVTITPDWAVFESKSYLMIVVQPDWKKVTKSERLKGLGKICELWHTVWGMPQAGQAEIRVFRNDPRDKNDQIGGCKTASDAWLSE